MRQSARVAQFLPLYLANSHGFQNVEAWDDPVISGRELCEIFSTHGRWLAAGEKAAGVSRALWRSLLPF